MHANISWVTKIAVVLACTLSGFFTWNYFKENSTLSSDDTFVDTIKSGIQSTLHAPGALVAKIESNAAELSVAGIFRETNAHRTKEGRTELILDQDLSRIARIRMQDMFEKGYFEHVSPEGQSASSVANDIGYAYASIGENIALGNFSNDTALVQAWMDSPGHRENIVRTEYSHIGIATERGRFNGKDTWIAVQIFSKPLSACPVVDANLKKQIEQMNAELKVLTSELSQKESELESYKEQGDVDRYNAEVPKYNALVQEVNNTQRTLKTRVDAYNVTVRAFNSCIQ